MSAVIPRAIALEILAKVGDAAARTPRELDAIAAEYGLTLKELGQLLDKAAETKAVRTAPAPAAATVRRKTCTKCGETKPLSEFFTNRETRDGHASWCRVCNNARRPTPSRLVRNRARGRAMFTLAQRHPEEFEQLLEEETAKAWAEHERVVAEAATKGHADAEVARLKTGPKRREQTDAVQRLDVARCPKCHTHHDADHVCPSCGSETSQPEGSKTA